MKLEISIPEGFQEVAPEQVNAVLSNSGNRGMGYFFKNDEIVIPDEVTVISQERETSNGDAITVPYIACNVNGKARWVPFSAFRRWPSKDSASFVERTPLMKSLFVGSDAERLQILKGITIVIREMVEGETRDWTACPAGFEGDIVYRKSKFPVLAMKA